MTGHKGPRARLHPLTRSITLGLHGTRGIALLELMLVIGIVAVATAAVVATASVVNAQRKKGDEVRHVQEITENINAASISSGDYAYATLNQENAKREGMFPKEMIDLAGEPKSAWGGDVLLTGAPVAGKADFGAALTYEAVPASACSGFVSDASPGFYSVSVNNTLIRDRYGPVDVAQLTRLCASSDTSRIVFLHAKNGGAGNKMPPPGGPPSSVPCTIPAPTTETVVDSACPAGQLGSRVFETRYTCYAETGAAIAQPPALLSDTCAPACILPTPATQVAQETRTSNQILSCPAGQAGAITQTRTEVRSRQRTASCPASPGYSAPVGARSWSPFSPWSPWTGPAWSTIANTCAPACVLPTPSVQTFTTQRTVEQLLKCPTGQVGAIRQSKVLTTPISRQAYCLQSTGSFGWAPWTVAGAVSESPWATISNTCAPVCVAPADIIKPITRSAPNEVKVDPCEPGFSGSITYKRSRVENGIDGTYYRCVAANSTIYTTQTSTFWLGTYNATSSWSMSRSCTTVCVPPAQSTAPTTRNIRSETRQIACFNNVPGYIVQERQWVEYGTQTTTWTCPYSYQQAMPSYTYAWSNTFGWAKWMYIDYQCDNSQPPAPPPTGIQ